MSVPRRTLLATPFAASLLAGCATAGSPHDHAQLQGGFAPVQAELDLAALPVRGEIPREIAGTWLRNGPNPAFPPIGYAWPWDGDGMVHALRFTEGRASYANRFVRTAGLAAERRAGRALFGSLMRPVAVAPELLGDDPALFQADGKPRRIKNLANTNVVHHAGRTLALWEGGLPYELDAGLETRGQYDFGGRLRGAMTAHPRLDPLTGEMLIARYAPMPPFLSYGVVNAAGDLARMHVLAVDQPYMVHDFVATARHVVFLLCPILFGPQFAGITSGPLAWKPELGTRIAVIDRADPASAIRWFDTEAFFSFHIMNAHQAGTLIHLDHAKYPSFPSKGVPPQARLWRLTLDLADGSTRQAQLDDRAVEFPRIDPARAGLANRYGWLPARTGREAAPSTFTAIARHDFATGQTALHDFGAGQEVDEPVFIPRPSSTAESDGWIMSYVYDRATDRSRAVLLHAVDIARPPIAEIPLPCRVPHGLHGNWLAA